MSAPAVAVSPDGKKFAAAWMDKRAGKDHRNVYWSISPTPAFSQDSLLTESTEGRQDHPTVALEKSGTAWAVWEDHRPGPQVIVARSSARGDRGQQVSEDAEGKASFPVVAANGGLVGVVYEADNRGERKVIFRHLKDK